MSALRSALCGLLILLVASLGLSQTTYTLMPGDSGIVSSYSDAEGLIGIGAFRRSQSTAILSHL
jgi:hypothetical protein